MRFLPMTAVPNTSSFTRRQLGEYHRVVEELGMAARALAEQKLGVVEGRDSGPANDAGCNSHSKQGVQPIQS
jgi:hypothetical protein